MLAWGERWRAGSGRTVGAEEGVEIPGVFVEAGDEESDGGEGSGGSEKESEEESEEESGESSGGEEEGED